MVNAEQGAPFTKLPTGLDQKCTRVEVADSVALQRQAFPAQFGAQRFTSPTDAARGHVPGEAGLTLTGQNESRVGVSAKTRFAPNHKLKESLIRLPQLPRKALR